MTFYTTAAHADLFARNIITVYYGADNETARAYNEFVSNASTTGWPSLGELTDFLESTSYQGVVGGETTDATIAQLALDAAISRIAQMTHTNVRPVDDAGDVDPAGDPVAVLPEIKLAALIQAAEWYRTRLDDAGGDLVEAVERLIGNHVLPGLA